IRQEINKAGQKAPELSERLWRRIARRFSVEEPPCSTRLRPSGMERFRPQEASRARRGQNNLAAALAETEAVAAVVRSRGGAAWDPAAREHLVEPWVGQVGGFLHRVVRARKHAELPDVRAVVRPRLARVELALRVALLRPRDQGGALDLAPRL